MFSSKGVTLPTEIYPILSLLIPTLTTHFSLNLLRFLWDFFWSVTLRPLDEIPTPTSRKISNSQGSSFGRDSPPYNMV